ncbi:MAG: SAF domain-containing protein [Candidatus Melainabacteria bacterium]|nr:SAF domain-containing protein [Candidatus Melainabacteria bacterium]
MSDINLDDIRIASPCKVPWESMKGTDTKRYCSQCQLNVYNISEMTTAEAVKLVGSDTGFCFSLYRRPDGTVITRDCPIGVAKLKRYFKWSVALIGSFLTGSIMFQHFMAKEIEAERERQKVYSRARRDLGFSGPLSSKGKTVICKKDVAQGEVFSADTLEEVEMEYENMPKDAVYSAGLLEGKIAAINMSAGRIISQHEITDPPSNAYRLQLDWKTEERILEIGSSKNQTLSQVITEWIREKLF